MKQLLEYRQSQAVIQSASLSLLPYNAFIASKVARKPEHCSKSSIGKLLSFINLLYTGPVAFLGKLPGNMCKNFLLLSIATCVLLIENLCKTNNECAKKKLLTFIKHLSVLCGWNMLVHNLIHLANDVLKQGLPNFFF